MKKIERVLDRIFSVISIFCLVGLICTVLIQVISRSLLPQAPSWTEEVSRFFFISGVFYTTGLAKSRNAYVNVDILEQKLHSNARKVYSILINLLVLGFNLVVFVESIGFTQSGATFIADTVPITMNYIYFGTMVSSFFLMLYTVFDMIKVLTNKNEEAGDAQ
ncbi:MULTISPECIES: TRAP transporter small permease [Acutalibacteraceae]|uniref:TRAP transporter small permease n=1 Tax=Acutalibacteraceae TaxID=3082771 RepID=UPI0013E8E5A0|nr:MULTISPECIES: TRAP transporter small permease [Acutalibacteraceae]